MREVTHVVCTGCSLLCDDIKVTVEGSSVRGIYNACSRGCSRLTIEVSEERLTHPLIRVDGKLEKTNMENAVRRLLEILKSADRPLLYGWSNCVSEAQILGIKIAREVRGVIDSTSSFCQGVVYLAAREARGFHTATLGEVLNRADLLVFWGCNPPETHLRHFSRYTFFPRGKYRQTGFEERDSIVVDVRESGSMKIARMPVLVEPNSDYELIETLRAVIKGYKPSKKKISGIDVSRVLSISEKLTSARFCAIFYGLGLSATKGTFRNVAVLLSLASELNKRGVRCVVLPMAGHFNMVGFNRVMLEMTGFPYGVDFHNGTPYWNPGETTAFDLLKREEVDAVICVGADPVSHLPLRLAKFLSEIPTVYIGTHRSPTMLVSEVSIPVALAGIEQEGTAYRLDGVPLLLKRIIDPPDGVPSDVELLKTLLKKVSG